MVCSTLFVARRDDTVWQTPHTTKEQHRHRRKNVCQEIGKWLSRAVGLLFFLLHPAAFSNTDKIYRITIVNSGDTPIYRNVSKIIINTVNDRLAGKTLVNFEEVLVHDFNSPENKSFRETDLILAIGQKATKTAFRLTSSPNNSKPILSTLVLSQAYRNALAQEKKLVRKTSHTAIFLDNPPLRQIILARILLGDIHRIGILSSDFSHDSIISLEKTLRPFGIELRTEHIEAEDNLIRKLSYVLRDSNMLLAIPDPAILNRTTARNILLTTYRHRIPVIGFSESYVKAGALAAVFSSPEQIARQTGETLAKIISSNRNIFPKPAYPNYFSVAINNGVAQSLGIQSQRPDDLRDEIQQQLRQKK